MADGTEAGPPVAPGPGGLRIDELLVAPMGLAAARQWLEVVNVGPLPVALDGLQVQAGTPWLQRAGTLAGCPPLPPGGRALIGPMAAAARAQAGGQPLICDFGDVPLAHPAGFVRLQRGDVTVAQRRYGDGDGDDLPLPRLGRSLARQANGRWCSVLGPRYDGVDQGSPGQANPGCVACQAVVDGAPAGWRPQHVPPAHGVRLQQIVADPPGRDVGREVVVLQANCDGPVDLQGLGLLAHVAGRAPRRWTLVTAGCTPLAAGAQVRLPVGVQPGVPAPAPPFWRGPTLPNRAVTLQLVWDDDGVVLDTARFAALPHHAAVWRLPEEAAP